MSVATYRESFATFLGNGGGAGPDWLTALRRTGFDRFAALGFPTMRDEDWHYTSVAPLAETPFALPRTAAAASRATNGGASRTASGAASRTATSGALRSEAEFATLDTALAPYIVDSEWSRLVFINGRYAPELSAFNALPDDVEVTTLGAALTEAPAFVQAHLGVLASTERNAFAALNTAFFHDGVVVRIPDECVVTQPLHIVWGVDARAEKAAVHPRLLVSVGRNAQLTLVESFVSLGASVYFTNAVTELRLGQGAKVEHCKVQRESTEAFHVSTAQAHQGRDSVLHAFSFAAGARLSRANVYTTLAEPGGEGRLNGLYLLDGHQHCDHQTYVHHAAERCASRELYKGIVDDEAHGVFNGKVLVDAIAQKTDGKQTNHALLLSERAKVDTKPQLEIFADDVKCTHGATVGRIDEQMMFYLKSRGVNRDTARALLTYAFAADVLQTIETPALRDALQGVAFDRYNQPRTR